MIRSLFLFLSAVLTSSLALAAGSSLDQVLQIAKDKKISSERQWRKLLHFEEQGFSTYSQIDSTNFFLAENGNRDLDAELVATLTAMWNAVGIPEEKNPQCLFPARYKFIKKHLAPEITNFPDQDCPRFQKYLNALRGNSVSLVFSSFYLNNPSSAFGHTFLRINKAPAIDGRRYELLDYGINYAADSGTSGNPISFAVMGLFGFFPGRFTSVPYYMKVREYNNSESRDLWEYELNTSPEVVEMVIAHVWELGPAYIDYWYLTENCSYHMLTILEAADPSIDILPSVKKWVIPSDTVKDAWNIPGLVRSFNYRPSVRTEFYYRIKSLDDPEQELLKEMVSNRTIPADLEKKSEIKRRDILDAAIDYVDFKYPNELVKPTEQTNFKNRLLAARSAVNLKTEILKIPVPEKEQSHLAHGSRRHSLGYRGSQQGDDMAIIGVKYALHSRTDLITGYPEYAAIHFGDFAFGYSRQRQRLELEDLNLVEVISYSPVSRFMTNLSWRVKVGIERMKDENCINCHGAVFSGGSGYTFQFSANPALTWFLGLRGAAYYTPTGPGDRFLAGVGPSSEIRVRWSDNLISTLEGWYRRDLNTVHQEFQEVNFTTQYSWNRNWAVSLTASDVRYDKTAQGMLYYFY